MLFKDYCMLLKKYYKKKPSDLDLCRALFDSVIYNLKEDEFRDVDKAVVSKILKGERSLPTVVRDHIYDDSVEEGIADYFEDVIVPNLIPQHSNLLHELVLILEAYPSISKLHLSALKSLAKETSIDVFLAEVFRLAVVEGTLTDKSLEKQDVSSVIDTSSKSPVLALCGISKDNELIKGFISEDFGERTNYTKDYYRDNLLRMYKDVACMHLVSQEKVTVSNVSRFSIYEKARITDETKELIEKASKALSYSLPADFFDLGGLEFNPLSSIAVMGGGVSLIGLNEEKTKYESICRIEETIKEYLEAIPFIEAFDGMEVVRFAIKNSGKMHDENIRVDLFFSKGSVLTFSDISAMDDRVYDYIMYEIDKDKCFGIKRENTYLDFESSQKPSVPKAVNTFPVATPFGYSASLEEYADKEEELADYFGFFISEKNDKTIISITMDEIMHNDAVAFPSVVLLKNKVTSIPFTIRSKYETDIVEGVIKLVGE